MLDGSHCPGFSEQRICGVWHGPDLSRMREKATGIVLDSAQMAHPEGEKTPADKSKGPMRPLS